MFPDPKFPTTITDPIPESVRKSGGFKQLGFLPRVPSQKNGLWFRGQDAPLQIFTKILRIIATDPKGPPGTKMDNDARSTPNVPNPPAPDTHVDSPTIQKEGTAGFHPLDIPVSDRPAEEGNGTKTDR